MPTGFLRMYAIGLTCFFALDLAWLGVVAQSFYQRQLGHLLRPDVQWGAAILFYLIFVAALVVFVAAPAAERRSYAHALGFGAFFGLATYAAFDLTCLALFKEFPLVVVIVDLAWGAALSATVSAAVVASERRSSRSGAARSA